MMGISDSPDCSCGFSSQDLNHIFWACPFLKDPRKLLYKSLRKLNLQELLSIEYLLGNINKSIASICVNFCRQQRITWRYIFE